MLNNTLTVQSTNLEQNTTRKLCTVLDTWLLYHLFEQSSSQTCWSGNYDNTRVTKFASFLQLELPRSFFWPSYLIHNWLPESTNRKNIFLFPRTILEMHYLVGFTFNFIHINKYNNNTAHCSKKWKKMQQPSSVYLRSNKNSRFGK